MANQKEIEAHYDTIGVLHALRMRKAEGQFPDYTCAFFDGDYSKTIQEAQEDKHNWIFENLGLGDDLVGKSILDIGCGWGPMLNAIRKRRGKGMGLTLSSGQTAHCRKRGLDARLLDYKNLEQASPPTFEGVVSVGAMEAFCSIEEFKEGKQDDVYKNLFRICAEKLKPGGRLFIQTMIWGKKVPDPNKLSPKANPHSEEAILSRIAKFYPGSWLPASLEQIIDCAKPYFSFVMSNNGRLDYLETLNRWGQNTKYLFSPYVLARSLKAILALAGKAIISNDVRLQLASLYYDDQAECFRREIMTHERIFFERN